MNRFVSMYRFIVFMLIEIEIMITKKDLMELSDKRFKDSQVLLNNSRYNGAVYLAGYVIELSLKLNVCKFFKLERGYPEVRKDLDLYDSEIKNKFLNASRNVGLRTFKTHNLEDLLLISGKKPEVLDLYPYQRAQLTDWTPKIRYLNQNIRKKEAESFLTSVSKIKTIL